MGDTTIEWTQKTWNPVRGCSRVSDGCTRCYAETMAARFSGPGQPYEGLVKLVRRDVRQFKTINGEPTADTRTVTRSEPRWTGEVRMVPEHLADPLRWRKPRRIFVNSMSDLFHEKLTNEEIAAVFGVMAAAPRHTFQVLTKRAERMRDWFRWVASFGPSTENTVCRGWLRRKAPPGDRAIMRIDGIPEEWPLPNVWLGVSVENQAAADERVPLLLETPAAVRFLSCEPLLGDLYLTPWLAGLATRGTIGPDGALHSKPHPPLDWVIAGCESGRGARPAEVNWFRSLRDQCAAAGVPYFLKQAVGLYAGAKRPGDVVSLPELDGVQHAAFPEVR